MNAMYQLKHILVCFFILSCIVYSFAQPNTQMQFFPANENHFAGLNVYDSNTGEYNQYYVKDGQWVKNGYVPQPKLSIKGGNYRMTFIPGSKLQYAGLFVYSKNSGEFEMFYLENGAWKNNGLFPKYKISYGGEMVIDFIPAKGAEDAYLTAYSTSSNKFGIYFVNGMKWVKSELYP